MSKEKVIETAHAELGVTEFPAGSNRTKYGAAYGLDGYPWCVMFLWWLFYLAGESAAFFGGGKTASCVALMRYYQTCGLWFTSNYRPGDIAIMNFSGTQDTEHCGLVVETHPDGSVTTIEGNTTPGEEGSQDNGGCVARKRRYSRNILGVCRPQYSITLPTDVPAGFWAADSIRWAVADGIMQGFPDGSFRPDEPATRAQMAEVLYRYHKRFGG